MKPNSKIILFYFKGMRSHILYCRILNQNPNIFDCVIEMPAIPYERSSKKRNLRKIIKLLFLSPGFFFMHLIVVKFFSILSTLSKSSIKDFCLKNRIDYYSFTKIDKNLLDFIKNKKPTFIISSTQTILTKEFIDIPKHGVINFHEAPLPEYRGSASYFWFIVNNEKFVNTTVHYVAEELDTGPIIFEGPKVKVCHKTVFALWYEMLQSHKESWNYMLPYLLNGEKIPEVKQISITKKAYTFPDKKNIRILKRKRIPFINFKDLKFVFCSAINGFE